MKTTLLLLNIIIFSSVAFIGNAMADQKLMQMPPHLNLKAKPKEVLGKYPIGKTTKQAAFSHHGGADRKIMLPNQMEGWVYNVGEKEWHRTYTLVINKAGVITDVLYYDHTRNADHGLTAMQLQSKKLIVGHTRLGPAPEL